MKVSRLIEARQAGRNKQWWVVVDELAVPGEDDIIGLFNTPEAAKKYRDKLLDDFGEVVTFNLEVRELKTPEAYYKETKAHYNWLQD